jgi:hypothetical protein
MALEWEIQINLIILKISEGDLIFKKIERGTFPLAIKENSINLDVVLFR